MKPAGIAFIVFVSAGVIGLVIKVADSAGWPTSTAAAGAVGALVGFGVSLMVLSQAAFMQGGAGLMVLPAAAMVGMPVGALLFGGVAELLRRRLSK